MGVSINEFYYGLQALLSAASHKVGVTLGLLHYCRFISLEFR